MFLSCVLAVLAQNPNPPADLAPEIPAVARPTYYPGYFFDVSADGKRGLSGFMMEHYLQFLRVWDLETGVVLLDLSLGRHEQVTSAKFSPDGRTIAVAMGTWKGANGVSLLDARTGGTLLAFGGFRGIAQVRGFSADGKQLLTVDLPYADRETFKAQLVTWDTATGKKLSSENATFDNTHPTATPDRSVRARFSDNREIVIEREGQKPFVIPNTRGVNFMNLFLTPDGKRVIGGTHAWAEIYDTKSGERLRVIQNDSQTITAVASADGGKLLFVAVATSRVARGPEHDAGWVHVWDMAKPELKTVIGGFKGDLWKVQPTEDGKRFTVLRGDGWRVHAAEVWDTAAKKRLHVFERLGRDYTSAAVSPDGNWAALTQHGDGEANPPHTRVWNTETGKLAEEVSKAATGTVGTLAFTPDSKRLIVVSHFAYSEWDVKTGKRETAWKHKQDEKDEPGRYGWRGPVVSLSPLPGGKGVVIAAPTGKRRQSYIVDLMTEKKHWYLGEFWDYVSTPVVSPNGQWMALIGGTHREQQGVLLKLNADGTPELMKKPERHWGPVFDGDKVVAWRQWPVEDFGYHSIIAFSPDGQRLFTGGLTHAVRIWGTESQKLQATLYVVPPAKPDDVPKDWVMVAPSGHFLGTPVGEQTLRFRDASLAAWLGWSSTGVVPAMDFPQLRDPEKVKAALGTK